MKIMPTDLPLTHWQRVAQQNGISAKTFRYRLKRHTPKAAATMPLNNTGRPANPQSDRQQSLAAGLPAGAITQHRYRHPNSSFTTDQIIAELKRQQAKRGNTLSDKAKAAGIPRETVYRRIQTLGWTLERALNTPSMTTHESARLGGKARAQQKRQRRDARKNA